MRGSWWLEPEEEEEEERESTEGSIVFLRELSGEKDTHKSVGIHHSALNNQVFIQLQWVCFFIRQEATKGLYSALLLSLKGTWVNVIQ